MPDSSDWLKTPPATFVNCFAEIMRPFGPSRASQDRNHPPGLLRNPVERSSEEGFLGLLLPVPGGA